MKKRSFLALAILFGLVILSIVGFIMYRNKNHHPLYSWNAAKPEDIPPDACDKLCGTGHAFRPVWCQDYKGNVVDDKFCSKLGPKPDQMVPCNTQPCDWEKKQIKACPDCGVNQFSTWEVTCPNGGCDESTKPPDKVACTINPCKWNYSNWTPDCPPCDDKSGAQQKRTATCSVADASQCGPTPSDLTNDCKYDSGNVCSWGGSSSSALSIVNTTWKGSDSTSVPVVMSFTRNAKGNVDINFMQSRTPGPDYTSHAYDVNLSDFFNGNPLKLSVTPDDQKKGTGGSTTISYISYNPSSKSMTIHTKSFYGNESDVVLKS